MIRLGVVNPETWDFFGELYAFFSSTYATSLFQPRRVPSLPLLRERLGRRLLGHDLKAFLRGNEVVFFEWASHLLALATSFPKSCGIVTRLHRWELYTWADRIQWQSVDRIILVSEAKRIEFLQRFPEQAEKVVVIPESVDLNRFKFQSKPFSGTIGTLCHLRPRKRVYELILAFSEMRGRIPGACLHIGGNEVPDQRDYHEALLRLVKRLGLADCVHFDGFTDKPWEWYRKIDIFISNSYSEGLQVSPMEAMASGCYTLSHWWDGAEELLPEEQLYYSDRQLAEKVVEFFKLGEATRRSKIQDLHRLVDERFDIDKNKLQVGRLIEEVAARRG